MKFKKDVALALATVAGALVALFALFVSIPVWFEAVIITLTVVGGIMTVSEIVKARRASYDEETETYTYKFPVRVFVFGVIILIAVAAIILLCLKALFGFALIPLAALLATLFVVAYLKKLRVMKWIVGVLFALLVVALISYFAAVLVNSNVNLNPGMSTTTTETTTPETETEGSETVVPEKETDVPETDDSETETPETEGSETDGSKTETPETEGSEPTVPDTEVKNPVVEDEKEDNTTKNPVEEVEKPEETQPTTPETEFTPVVIKIDAPKTMSYAEPITIKLEGIKAQDLKFGNEDFLSIVIISDSEVEVTLVGIVNDAGEVEFTPGSGYITVTDSVSGVHTTIEIVG